jgi:hypothetical protein
MLTGLVDHLWQSCCCCGVVWIFSMMTRGNAAVVRLWLWRIAALKLLLPFSLLFALGAWLGFPSPHPADPAPPALIRLFEELTQFATPARAYAWTGLVLIFATLVALACTAACAYVLRNRLRIERLHVQEEAARREQDVDVIQSRPGFLASALMSAVVLVAVSIPMLAGAVQDRQQRRERLIVNSLSLRNAPYAIKPSATGMGTRYRIDADAHGVTIRNANIHDLVAIVYGVRRHAVITPQMMVQGESAARSWLHWPRYDVRVEAPVPEPRDFEPYALRQGLTKLLAEQFGLEIYVNGDCQPPCGNYRVALAEEPL